VPGRAAVIVGVGQVRNRPELDGPWRPIEPARLMAMALESAAEDAGHPSLIREADFLASVSPIAWRYGDTPRTLAGVLEISPDTLYEPAVGGDGPVALLNYVANCIQSGDVKIALLTGAETLYSRRRARKEGVELDWLPFDRSRSVVGDQRPFANPIETRHGVIAPIQAYPLFENALRAESGRGIDDHQVFVSKFMAHYSEVAAKNPYSWFPEPRTAEEIRAPGARNRWVCFPYPKLMNAIMEVDQAAACIMMSEAEAERLEIPESQRVAYLGGAKAADAWTPTERVDFVSSAAYRAAAEQAMEFAHVDLDDIDLFDLYSCFPSAVQFAAKELKLALDDPRGLTRTGGLAHHGGPGNNYSMHSVANVVTALRSGEGQVALVSALGMSATKHAVAILSTDAARKEAAEGCSRELEMPPELVAGPELVDHPPTGPAEVETYTVHFEKDNTPDLGIVVLRLADGRRSMAHIESKPAEFAKLLDSEGVGKRGTVQAGEELEPNRFSID